MANSPDTGPLTAGNYSFRAIYSGDTTHAPSLSACEPFRVVRPSITVTKTASPAEFSAPGEVITYTYRVTNSGDVVLNDITLTNSRLGTISCPRDTLDPGEHMDCTATYTTTQADVDRGSIHNSALVTGQPPTGPPVTDRDEETVTAIHKPAIDVNKTASPAEFSRPGQVITYTYRVTNTGNVTLHNITVTDSRLGTISCPRDTLSPGEHMDCTATHTTTQADVDRGSIHNGVLVTGRPPTGPRVTGRDEVTVEFTVVRPPPPPPPVPPTGPVSVTGVNVVGYLVDAAALILVGAALLLLSRRRRGRHAAH